MYISQLIPHSYFAESLLIEANIINAADDYNGTSILSFLKPFTNNFNSPELKQTFIKKMSRLLMNDHRFLYAARELPANAPEWAIKARDAGDLMYFQPNDTLTDRIDNISHYLASLESDAASNDPQKKADARKELQGFPKAETLDIIIKAATEFFAKGTKKMRQGDVSGMEMILDLPNGFTWYELKDQDAFVREGKVLQNCIGRYYTQQSAEREGLQIYILKDPKGESVVGVRAKGKDLFEVKGKQNNPPVGKYMPPVQHLINHFKFIPTSSGLSDITDTGYFYHKGLLYSRPQAIKTLFFGTTDSGIVVDEISSDVDGLLRQIYQSSFNTSDYLDWGKPTTIYTGHVSDKLDTTIFVTQGVISVILNETPDQQGIAEAAAADAPIDKDPTFQILKLLADKKRITGTSDNVTRLLQWHHHIGFDQITQQFVTYNPGKPESTGPDTHQYHTYSGDKARAMARTLTSDRFRDRIDPPADVDKIYTSKIRTDSAGRAVTLVTAVTKQGKMLPYVVTGSDVTASNAAKISMEEKNRYYTNYVPDEKTLKTLVDLANTKNLTLPHNFRIKHGLTKDGDNYEKINIPEEQLTDFPGKMWDISKFGDYDKVAALYQISARLSEKLDGYDRRNGRDRLGIRSSWSQYVNGSSNTELSDTDNEDESNFGNKTDRSDLHKNEIHRRERPTEWLTKEFGGETPTAIYAFNIKYGTDKSHEVIAFVHNNTITRLDGLTVVHSWQSWDDYNFVTTQLNSFASAHKLTYSSNALKMHLGNLGSKAKEFVIINNQVSTKMTAASNKLAKALSKRKGGVAATTEMEFVDGTTLTRMDPDAFGTWSRKIVSKEVSGEPWIINKDGKDSAIIIVRNNKVLDIYTNSKGAANNINDINSNRSNIIKYLPYIKGASEKLGWTSSTKKLIVGRDSTDADVLRYIKKRNDAPVKEVVLQRSNEVGSSVSGVSAAIRRLVNAGLIRSTDMNHSTIKGKIVPGVRITATGSAVANSLLATDDDVNVSDVIKSAAVSSDFKIPEPATVSRPVNRNDDTATPRTSTRTPMEGGGSKADQALALFTQLAADNGGTMPERSEFITKLMAAPFNMTKAGASTYQYNIKAKYLKQQGTIPEGVTFKRFLTLMG